MWQAIVLLLGFIGKAASFYLEGKATEKEKDAAYLAFIEASTKAFGSSARMKASYDRQKQRMEEARKKEAQGGQNG